VLAVSTLPALDSGTLLAVADPGILNTIEGFLIIIIHTRVEEQDGVRIVH
jgi:hypothetical protein